MVAAQTAIFTGQCTSLTSRAQIRSTIQTPPEAVRNRVGQKNLEAGPLKENRPRLRQAKIEDLERIQGWSIGTVLPDGASKISRKYFQKYPKFPNKVTMV